jgi:hypothetical protein
LTDETQPQDVATLRLFGADAEQNSVPFDVLARVLEGMQHVVYLLASAADPRLTARQRFKPSQEVKQRYQLRAEVPQAGSYAVPLTIGSPELPLPLSTEVTPAAILAKLDEAFQAVATGAQDTLRQVIPDAAFRTRVMRHLTAFLPKAGERWAFGFKRSTGNEVELNHRAARQISEWLQAEVAGDEAVLSVIGELQEINFAEHKLLVLYRPTSTPIECLYDPDIEETMIASRRDNVQVTGRFELDGNGNPRKLTDVTRIDVVDLSPLVLEEVELGERVLKFDQPVVLHPSLDEETGQLYVVEDPDLGLDAFGYTRDELLDEVNSQLLTLWDEYANEEPDKLTASARRLRDRLRTRIREVAPHATR